ncbi:hypothetical protein VKT23_008589 [Stygiomarasmius scandens]|uniref:Uncharacterized protein n=1 Tax=Marasmiellus scandens TaxID=2682957 RepID=A0ABR1JM64_9AGAR
MPDASSDDAPFDVAEFETEGEDSDVESEVDLDAEEERERSWMPNDRCSDDGHEVSDLDNSNEVIIHSPRPRRSLQRPQWLDPVLAVDEHSPQHSVPTDVDVCSDSDWDFDASSPIPATPPRNPVTPTFQTCSMSTRMSTPGAFISTSTGTPSLSVQVRDLQLENIQLRAYCHQVEAEHDAANVHAVFTQREASINAFQRNKKKLKKDGTSRRIHTRVRILTSEEGRLECQEDEARQTERRRMAEGKEQQWKEKERETLEWRITQTQTSAVFSGTLSTKNKGELGDIAALLALSVEGTKEEIKICILQHFDNHPEKKTHHCYVGLFQSHGWKRAVQDENDSSYQQSVPAVLTPALQRRRLDDLTNHHRAQSTVFPSPLHFTPAVSYGHQPNVPSSSTTMPPIPMQNYYMPSCQHANYPEASVSRHV